jgi:hypothetical protein
MNVYLIKTPEYPETDYESVLALLNSFPGPIKFLSSLDQITAVETVPLLQRLFPENSVPTDKIRYLQEQQFPPSWKRFFSECDSFRLSRGIPAADFVILLTNQKNGYNFFSMFDGRNNSFVDCADWDIFTHAPHHYPVAYEVLANILRTLMNPEMVLPNPLFHQQTRGCVNDLCMKKAEISLKLRTADVCSTCMEQLRSQQIDELVLEQVLKIFEGIRIQVLFREGSRSPSSPGQVELTHNNKIYFRGIGNLELKLYPLDKTVFVFYLNHLEGVRLNELSDHIEELLSLYRRFSVADTNEVIIERIHDLVNRIGGSFSQKKSRLNRTLTTELGERYAAIRSMAMPENLLKLISRHHWFYSQKIDSEGIDIKFQALQGCRDLIC